MICSLLIHFIYKKKHRNLISFQKPPQSHGMALYAVHAVYYQYRIVKHLKGTLHFRRKIHMARSIQKRDLHLFCFQPRLLGKYSNSPFPLQLISIQKGISMIHSSQLSYFSAKIKKPFG